MLCDATEASKFVCPICSYAKHTVICGECTSGRLEAIRNSVIDNEHKNELMRREINAIFELIHNPAQLSLVSIPSASIEKLRLSILTLDLNNLRTRHRGIQKSLDLLAKKTVSIKTEIDRQKLLNIQLRQTLEEKQSHIVSMANQKHALLDKDTAATKLKSNLYINRQSTSIQLDSFRVLREIWLSGKRLRHGRVLQLLEFAAEGHPLDTVNRFLEDCIQLQIVLFDLFSVKDSQLELPYLEYLRKLLPDSAFYDSVQSKISALVKVEDEEETSEDAKEPEEHVDKIVIKDNVLLVPRSSRTMNLQRRSSVRASDVSQAISEFQSNAAPSPGIEADTKAKRIVIVPHKMLKKPFSKLEPGEYLKFVLVVVKILVNFNCLIQGVSDFYGPRVQRKFSYDFKEILEEVCKLEELLKAAGIEGWPRREEHSDSLHSSTTTIEASTMSLSKNSLKSPPDGPFQKIYNKYLGRKPRPSKPDTMDGIIYGLVSEAKIERARPKSHKGIQVHVGKASLDLKEIVGRVHERISGGGGHRAFGRGAHSQDFEIAMSMMERSKAHLEDWDMVSRMY